MNLFDRLRTQKVLSFTLILFTLSVGIVIGTLVNQGVKAARSDNPAAPGATPLVIPNPVELSNSFSQLAKQVESPSLIIVGSVVSLRKQLNWFARLSLAFAPLRTKLEPLKKEL